MNLRQASAGGVTLVACIVASLAAAGAAVNCSFTAASGVAFGSYDVFKVTPTLGNGTLTLNCTGVGAGTASVTIDLNRGTNSPAFPNRNMANGAQLLGYNLYQDAGLTVIWGNGNRGTVVYGPILVSNNTPVTVTIFGAIPSGQDLTAGSYTDTIKATLNY
jgi:spore coat protein U-like protein